MQDALRFAGRLCYMADVKACHAAAIAALLGLVVPLILEALCRLFDLGPDWSFLVFLLWPSSLQLMVLEDRPPIPVAVMVCAISIGINVILYAVIGWVAAITIRWAKVKYDARHTRVEPFLLIVAFLAVVAVAWFAVTQIRRSKGE